MKSVTGNVLVLGVQWLGCVLVLTLTHALAARAYGRVCGCGVDDLSSFVNWGWLVLGHSSPWCPAFLYILSSTGTLMSTTWLGGFGLLGYYAMSSREKEHRLY